MRNQTMRKLAFFGLALPLCIVLARAVEYRGEHNSTVTMNNDSASDDCRDHLRVGDNDYRSNVRDEEVKTVPNQPLTITAEHNGGIHVTNLGQARSQPQTLQADLDQ